MQFRLEPVKLDDRSVIAEIAVQANRGNPFTEQAWLNSDLEGRFAAAYARFARDLMAEGAWFMKAVNDGGLVVAYAQWTFPKPIWERLCEQHPLALSEEERKRLVQEYEESLDNNGRSRGIRPEVRLEAMAEVRARVFPSHDMEEYVELDQMRALPSHQRKGAGRMLLQWGIDLARRHGVPIYLESTPNGLWLYKRAGFQEIGEASEDLRKFGGSTEYSHVFMVLQPQSLLTAGN